MKNNNPAACNYVSMGDKLKEGVSCWGRRWLELQSQLWEISTAIMQTPDEGVSFGLMVLRPYECMLSLFFLQSMLCENRHGQP